jgi:ParB family chromosome partitioning protein
MPDSEPADTVQGHPGGNTPGGSSKAPRQPDGQIGLGEPFEVGIDLLEPNPLQPRRVMNMEYVLQLSESLRQSGMLQPIVVRRRGDKYQIIAGERRWRAAQEAGMKRVPVTIREADETQMLEWALVENIQREDLNAIDRARAYKEYCERFDRRPEEVATRLGEDRSTVVNYLRLLELEPEIQDMVCARRLSMGHARSLLGVTDPSRRHELADAVIAHQLSVRALEDMVRRHKDAGDLDIDGVGIPDSSTETGDGNRSSAHVRDLERQFESALKTKVTVREGRRKGTGRIIIEYYSFDDFDRIASALGVTWE